MYIYCKVAYSIMSCLVAHPRMFIEVKFKAIYCDLLGEKLIFAMVARSTVEKFIELLLIKESYCLQL